MAFSPRRLIWTRSVTTVSSVAWGRGRDAHRPFPLRENETTTHVNQRAAARRRREHRPVGPLFLRPPAGARYAFLHRNVGALQLLRHPRPAHLIYDRHGG